MNYLVIATGSNLSNPIENLNAVRKVLALKYSLLEASRIYNSKAVDYEAQPDFFNQVLLFEKPSEPVSEVLKYLLEVEQRLGRTREVHRGPRTIDLDIIFLGKESLNTQELTIPHPRFLQRSFVVRPLLELSLAAWLQENYQIPDHFDTEALAID